MAGRTRSRQAAGPAARLEAFFRKEIPLARRLGARVLRHDRDGLELFAPLAPNLNHKRTAFGGSLYSLAVLAAWGAARLLLEADGPAHVVIQEGSMTYLRPVQGDFRARCDFPPAAAVEAFRRALKRKGKARLALRCEVREAPVAGAAPAAGEAGAGSSPAAVFQGVFAASGGREGA